MRCCRLPLPFFAAVCFAALATSTMARAEGRCPPGFYPTGGGTTGWLSCAPMGPIEDEAEPEPDGGGGGGLPPMRFDPAQWRVWMETARKGEELREAERIKDPAYRKLKQGHWEYATTAARDREQTCLASFLTPQGGVLLMDWAGAHPGTFLGFFGGAIPPTAEIVRQRLSLTQSGETQTVDAFRAPLPCEKRLAMVMFAVPSTKALLDAIEDAQDFEVKSGDTTYVWGKWHSGKQARDRLSQCVTARRR